MTTTLEIFQKPFSSTLISYIVTSAAVSSAHKSQTVINFKTTKINKIYQQDIGFHYIIIEFPSQVVFLVSPCITRLNRPNIILNYFSHYSSLLYLLSGCIDMDEVEAISAESDEHPKNIPKLGKLAFKVFYKEVLCRAAPGNINFVRDLIDNHLIGTVKRDFRYNNNYIHAHYSFLMIKYKLFYFPGRNVWQHSTRKTIGMRWASMITRTTSSQTPACLQTASWMSTLRR